MTTACCSVARLWEGPRDETRCAEGIPRGRRRVGSSVIAACYCLYWPEISIGFILNMLVTSALSLAAITWASATRSAYLETQHVTSVARSHRHARSAPSKMLWILIGLGNQSETLLVMQ